MLHESELDFDAAIFIIAVLGARRMQMYYCTESVRLRWSFPGWFILQEIPARLDYVRYRYQVDTILGLHINHVSKIQGARCVEAYPLHFCRNLHIKIRTRITINEEGVRDIKRCPLYFQNSAQDRANSSCLRLFGDWPPDSPWYP
jgi:hypothetical protein